MWMFKEDFLEEKAPNLRHEDREHISQAKIKK